MAWTKQVPSAGGFVQQNSGISNFAKNAVRQLGYLMTEDGYVLASQLSEDIMLDFHELSKSLPGTNGWVKQVNNPSNWT